jgi:hypothetical protein
MRRDQRKPRAPGRLTSSSTKRQRLKVMDKLPPARFLADARRGMLTRQELATKYGLSYGAACAHIKNANIPLPRQPAKLPARVAAKRSRRKIDMRALRKQGKTLLEIGVRYGVTRERVRQILNKVARMEGAIRPCPHPRTKAYGVWWAGKNTPTKSWSCRVCNRNRRHAAKGA